MNISNDLINIIKFAIDTLIKSAGIDMRLHGIENIPDQPVVYVVNHFTRLETVLMPYIIKKNINKNYMNFSNLSLETLHIGHTSGGLSLAQRYPQTLQRHTGFESSVDILTVISSFIFSRTDGDGLLSGIDCSFFSPDNIPIETYNPQ